jgi:DNA adenine methylase
MLVDEYIYVGGVFLDRNSLKPFLKWPGGKKWLIPQLESIIPQKYSDYIEPFIGGGSIFFRISPSKAIISDINNELINLYTIMRDSPQELLNELEMHQKQHKSEYYYEIRAKDFSKEIERAGRFLYLNRACYNGMYRVNQQGKFNVPIGSKTNFLYDKDCFADYSDVLKKATILQSDFGEIIQKAKKNDLIFADPPYTIAHNQNSFIKYNEKLFTWEDQERLLKELLIAKEKGSIIILTNANYQDILDMYSESGFNVTIVKRYCSIAGDASRRKKTEELLITSFPIEDNIK